MNSCMIFLGKELKEYVRSWKLLVLGIVFILFGIMSPATAKYTPELVKALGGGIELNLPPVTVTDSYLQFFKNINGIGVIVILLVFAGIVAGEKQKGSAQIILTKSISRASFLLAKYLGAALLWTAIYAAGALVCQAYTIWLFPGDVVSNLLPAFLSYWLFGLLLLSFVTLASAVANGFGMAALGSFAGWGILLLSMLPVKIAKYSPAALGSVNLQVILGSTPASDLWIPAAVAVALIALALGLASWSLSKQEL